MSLEGKEIPLPVIGTWAFYAKESSWNYPCLIIDRDESTSRSTGQTCSIVFVDLQTKQCEEVRLVKKKNIWNPEDCSSKLTATQKSNLQK